MSANHDRIPNSQNWFLEYRVWALKINFPIGQDFTALSYVQNDINYDIQKMSTSIS